MSGKNPDKFAWQRAIVSGQGPESPTTRHVLLTLSVFMDGNCQNCFPSTKTLSSATGLSERTICTHLDLAEDAGWIKKIEKCGNGRAWRRHAYKALIPEKALKEVQRLNEKGTETGSVRHNEGTEPHAEGTEPDDIKALKEVQSTISVTRPYTSNNAKTFLLKDRTTYHVDDDFLTILKNAFPKVDVESELKKLSAWCFSNPSKRKTRKGAKRFINSWMANVQPFDEPIKPKEFDFENQFHEE